MQLPPASQVWPRQTAQVSYTPDQNDANASGARSQASPNTAPNTSQTPPASAPSTLSETVRGIFADYDLTAITPTEVDTLTTRLKDARFDDLGFVLSLERYGAIYASEMQAVYATSETDTSEDAPIDLLALTRSELALAERYGQPTERLSTQLFKLEEAQNSRAAPQTETTVSAPESSLAETLVLFQAQRLWIE